MIVDNLLGRGAEHLDASESSVDNADFRIALLSGWQRLEAAIERNFRMSSSWSSICTGRQWLR